VNVQNAGLFVAVTIAVSWVWGAAVTLQKNYDYQQKVDVLSEQIELTKLKNQNLSYEQAYLRSDEYLELKARQYLGKGQQGEKLVILPSSDEVKDVSSLETETVAKPGQTNFDKWMQFFFSNKSASSVLDSN